MISNTKVDDDDNHPHWKYRNDGGYMSGGSSRGKGRRNNRSRIKIIKMGRGFTASVTVNNP